MSRFSKRPYVAAAAIVSLFTVSSPAAAKSETYGEIAARIGVPMRDSSGTRLWSPQGDVDGKIGYPLSISGPRFDCPSGWTSNMSINSGTLPPGMSLNNNGDITGTPTERGHWIVTMKIDNITCGGHHYQLSGAPEEFVNYGLKQGFLTGENSTCAESSYGFCSLTTIRFHITGTGEVH